jgi:hypothetical protein
MDWKTTSGQCIMQCKRVLLFQAGRMRAGPPRCNQCGRMAVWQVGLHGARTKIAESAVAQNDDTGRPAQRQRAAAERQGHRPTQLLKGGVIAGRGGSKMSGNNVEEQG